jgi:hypothetical protein
MKKIASIALATVLVAFALAATHQPSAADRYREKVRTCQTRAIEGRTGVLEVCRAELPELLREAREEEGR